VRASALFKAKYGLDDKSCYTVKGSAEGGKCHKGKGGVDLVAQERRKEHGYAWPTSQEFLGGWKVLS